MFPASGIASEVRALVVFAYPMCCFCAPNVSGDFAWCADVWGGEEVGFPFPGKEFPVGRTSCVWEEQQQRRNRKNNDNNSCEKQLRTRV